MKILEKVKKYKKYIIAGLSVGTVAAIGAGGYYVSRKLKESKGKNLDFGFCGSATTDYGKERLEIGRDSKSIWIDNLTTMEEEPGCTYSGTRMQMPKGVREVNNGITEIYIGEDERVSLPFSGKFGFRDRLSTGYETFSGEFAVKGV